jgi:glutamate synthase (NADPH/NADH) small chain
MLKCDIDRILAMGAELKLNTTFGTDVKLEELQKEYDAVVLAIGCTKPKKLKIPGEEAKGVEHVIRFLESINIDNRKEIGKKVVVVGAGFSAMDAVRAARRLGSEATIVYRRDRDQMPATKDEVAEAEQEGVKMELLANPVEVIVKDGAVAGLKCIRMKLGAADKSGRPAPEPIPGSEFVIECDQVIQAISQESELSGVDAKTSDWNSIEADANGRTSLPKVWAAGDAVTGPKTIVDAVAAAIVVTKDILASF